MTVCHSENRYQLYVWRPQAILSTNFSLQSHKFQLNMMASDQPDEDPKYKQTIEEWVNTCNNLHKDACLQVMISQKPPDEVLKWVIDTTQHCLVPGSSANRYVALNYVWLDNKRNPGNLDGNQKSLMLNESSILEFQHPGFLNSENALHALPHVIRFAIGFTACVGERYLWIDRLSIPQSDGPSCDEEVMRMDKIYGGAYLTFGAAAPDTMFSQGSSL